MKKSIWILLVALSFAACDKNNHASDLYTIDNAGSVISWTGRTPYTANNGTVGIFGSNIRAKDGQLQSLHFNMPITSLKVLNLTGDLKEMLEHHLQSEDFFNVMKYPNASFRITSITDYTPTGVPGEIAGANKKVVGKLTMMGITREISFAAKVYITRVSIDIAATLTINRLDFDMDYHSDPELGEDYILPEVDLSIQLRATRTAS